MTLLIRVIRRERELNERRKRKITDKNVKYVKCKDVLRFICGLMDLFGLLDLFVVKGSRNG